MKRQGLFVSVEGTAGSGRSRVVSGLIKRLKNAGVPMVIATHGLGETKVGSAVSLVLRHGDLSEEALIFLEAAARSQQVDSIIGPGLMAGAVIVADTFSDNVGAWHSAAGSKRPELVEALIQRSVADCTPDLSFLLEGEPEVFLTRRNKERQRGELAFNLRARNAFALYAAREPSRYVVLNAEKPLHAIESAAWEAVKKALRERRIGFDEDAVAPGAVAVGKTPAAGTKATSAGARRGKKAVS